MKTRIKTIVYGDGSIRHQAQVFNWKNFFDASSMWENIGCIQYDISNCKKFIDELIQEKKQRTVNGVSYAKYP